MSKIQTQNPGSSEIQSSLIAGITEGLSKISGVLDLRVAELKDVKLNAISIDEQGDNKNRIYEVPDGNKLWLSSPEPTIKKNGVVITPTGNNFSVDCIGGSITFDKSTKPSDGDTITVSCQHITDGSNVISEMLADIQSNSVQANKYKGSYANPESLAQSVPTATNGDFAVVLTPPAMFVWVTSEWKDARSVEDLKNYYTQEQTNNLLKEKENKIVAKGSEASADDFYFSGRKTWLSASEKVKATELKGIDTSSKDPVSASDTVLSALGKLQGQATEASESHFIKGSGAPTTSTKGSVGQRYVNASNGDWYTCTSVSGNAYTWQKGANDKKVSDHIADKSNPHGVTAAQVGAYSKTETYSQAQVNGKVSSVEAKTDSHISNKNNPHEVTAKQVGALSESEYKGSATGVVKKSDDSSMLEGKAATAYAEQESIELFAAKLLLDGWSGGAGAYTQTVSCTGMQAAFDTEPPFTLLSGVSGTDEKLRNAINTICSGTVQTLAGQIKATVPEKPTCDIWIYLRRAVH